MGIRKADKFLFSCCTQFIKLSMIEFVNRFLVNDDLYTYLSITGAKLTAPENTSNCTDSHWDVFHILG